MAKVDLFDIYEKNVKPALEPHVEDVNSDDLFELYKMEHEGDGSFDISDDVLEKLAQRVAGIMKGSVNDDVAND